jgi:glycosyltransferase involved in cell wall biosynthesis
MRVLSIHNRYRQRGGEDAVFEDEAQLLEDNGHTVIRYTVSNDDAGHLNRVKLAGQTVWSAKSYRALSDVIAAERPDVAHVHNSLAMVSPSAYYAARRNGVAVVQTLHNYRLLCPGVSFLRDGKVCQDCLGRRFAWPAVRHGCYLGSRAASATVAAMITTHRMAGTWERQVNRYIAPTDFLRNKFIEGGFSAELIAVKPHFVATDPGPGVGEDGSVLYVGRLAEEKGLRTLLAAWEQAPLGAKLRIVGDGPLADVVETACGRLDGVEWLGSRAPDEVRQLMGEATVLIFPSECLEAFGLVIIEAFRAGTPVLASNLGPGAELIDHGRTGRHFQTGDTDDLAAQMRWFFEHTADTPSMRRHARAEYEEKYTAERNYEQLVEIYNAAIQDTRQR